MRSYKGSHQSHLPPVQPIYCYILLYIIYYILLYIIIRETTRATCHQCSLYIAFRPPIKGPTVWLNWPRIWDNFPAGNKTLCSLLYEIFETGRKVCHKIRIGNCFQKTCQIVLLCCLTGETRSSQQGVFFCEKWKWREERNFCLKEGLQNPSVEMGA